MLSGAQDLKKVSSLYQVLSVLTPKLDVGSAAIFSRNTGGVAEVRFTFPSSTRCVPTGHEASHHAMPLPPPCPQACGLRGLVVALLSFQKEN
ncbi:unnamed protein product [Rangifer tarandus platyrhynchus]|uniref:Uncharacterized protein n=1 Tax=Rangifer tarandus platyrhynchus TaxID=3082113 RepID=A0AC60A9F8_RANTA